MKRATLVFLLGAQLGLGSYGFAEPDLHEGVGHQAHEDHKDDDGHDAHEDHKDDDGHDAHESHDHKEHDGHEDNEGHDSREDHEAHKEHDGQEGHEAHQDHEESNEVSLTSEQAKTIGLSLIKVAPTQVYRASQFPAEIKVNAYRSVSVAAPVDSIVRRRFARLGQHVKPGDPLVSLFSADLSAAQSEFLIALSEFTRVKKLGKRSVGERRFVTAKNQLSASKAKLSAYGLDVEALARDGTRSPGEYTLRAQAKGVISDDIFVTGQRVTGGQQLLRIIDESVLWAEAKVSAISTENYSTASIAALVVGDKRWPAKLAQQSHVVDPHTRTRVLRFEITNADHELHAGMFGVVELQTDRITGLFLPQGAVTRDPTGRPTVFVQEGRSFHATPITSMGKYSSGKVTGCLVKGIAEGSIVAVNGAFFLASELAKSGFDPHNH